MFDSSLRDAASIQATWQSWMVGWNLWTVLHYQGNLKQGSTSMIYFPEYCGCSSCMKCQSRQWTHCLGLARSLNNTSMGTANSCKYPSDPWKGNSRWQGPGKCCCTVNQEIRRWPKIEFRWGLGGSGEQRKLFCRQSCSGVTSQKAGGSGDSTQSWTGIFSKPPHWHHQREGEAIPSPGGSESSGGGGKDLQNSGNGPTGSMDQVAWAELRKAEPNRVEPSNNLKLVHKSTGRGVVQMRAWPGLEDYHRIQHWRLTPQNKPSPLSEPGNSQDLLWEQ